MMIPIIFNGEGIACKYFYDLSKINSMTPQIRAALSLVPFKAYVRSHVRMQLRGL